MWPFKQKSTLTALESALLAEMASKIMPSETAELVRFQVAAISGIDRNCGGKEVIFSSRLPDTLKFLADGDMVPVATIRFSVAGHNLVWKAKIWSVQGRLSSLVFNLVPPELVDPAGLRIQEVTFHADLTKPSPKIERYPVSLSEIAPSGWFAEWAGTQDISEILAPLSEANRQRFISAFSLRFPSDYLELVGQCEGFTSEICSVLGLTEAYEVVLPYGNYVLIGEIPDRGFFGIRDDSEDGVVYLLGHEADEPLATYDSIRAALDDIPQIRRAANL